MTKIYAVPTTDGHDYDYMVDLPDQEAVKLTNIDPTWIKTTGRYLLVNVKIEVTLPSHGPPLNREIDLQQGSPDIHVGVVLFIRRQNKGASFYYPRSLPSSTTVADLKRIVVQGYDKVDGNDLVITLGPVTVMYHPELTSNEDLQKTLRDFQVADNDTITLHTVGGYSKLTTPVVKDGVRHHSPHDELVGKKYRIKNLAIGGGSHNRAIQYFTAERVEEGEEGGDSLFGPTNLLIIVRWLMDIIHQNNHQFIEYYSSEKFTEDPVKTLRLDGHLTGHRVYAVLKALHYNLDGESRRPPGSRTVTQRALWYQEKGVSMSDKTNYIAILKDCYTYLSKLMRIKVGEKFFSVPFRALPITQESSGCYDAHELKIEYLLGGSNVDQFDCSGVANRAHNKCGFAPPEWFLLSKLGIEEPKWFDGFKITSNAICVLIVEDGGAFNLLRTAKFYERFPCILVCNNGGRPSRELCAFVSMLSTTLELPVFGFCDMNNGGIEGLLGYTSTEDELFNIDIKWIGLRPSQLKSLVTSYGPHGKSLYDVLMKEDDETKEISGKSATRITNHIAGESTWVVSGGDRKGNREREMKKMLELGRGIDSQKADNDQVIAMIWRALVDTWSWQDDDKVDTNPGSDEPFMFAWS